MFPFFKKTLVYSYLLLWVGCGYLFFFLGMDDYNINPIVAALKPDQSAYELQLKGKGLAELADRSWSCREEYQLVLRLNELNNLPNQVPEQAWFDKAETKVYWEVWENGEFKETHQQEKLEFLDQGGKISARLATLKCRRAEQCLLKVRVSNLPAEAYSLQPEIALVVDPQIAKEVGFGNVLAAPVRVILGVIFGFLSLPLVWRWWRYRQQQKCFCCGHKQR